MSANRLKIYFKDEVRAASAPTFPHQVPNKELTIMGLYNLIHQMEQDRRELEEAVDSLVEDKIVLEDEVARLTQLLNGK